MFEGGSWDKETKSYVREEGPVYFPDSTCLPAYEDRGCFWRSPFESIPACFWWAIVTATTVGYGDNHTPTTPAGKVVAGISMVWSLCVLALPIGVIGSNFSQVWKEYDEEKKEEAE